MRAVIGGLVIFVVASALVLVTVRHHNRDQYSTYHALQVESDRLQDEWRQLLLENQTQSQPRRIEKKAIEQLGMTEPSPEEIVVVDLR